MERKTTLQIKLRRLLTLLLVLTIAISLVSCVPSPKKQKEKAIGFITEKLDAATDITLDEGWAVFAVKKAGQDIPKEQREAYRDSCRAMAKTEKGIMSDDPDRLTSNASASIILNALNMDYRNVEGYDLIKPLKDTASLERQGANAYVYAMIAYNSLNRKQNNEQEIKEKLMADMSIDSAVLKGNKAEVDYRAMGIQGLSYYKDEEAVSEIIDENLKFLESKQKKDGGYGNCESTAQVIIALTMLGKDPAKCKGFIKDGSTLIDGLMVYANGGGFAHTEDGDKDMMATTQALMALDAVDLQREGRPLF